MKSFREETEKVQVVDDIVCNRCGDSCRDEIGNFECVRAVESWGYYSTRDTFTAEWHLCEPCMEAVTSDFKIPVERVSNIFCIYEDGKPLEFTEEGKD